eukprot:EG_transcript_39395
MSASDVSYSLTSSSKNSTYAPVPSNGLFRIEGFAAEGSQSACQQATPLSTKKRLTCDLSATRVTARSFGPTLTYRQALTMPLAKSHLQIISGGRPRTPRQRGHQLVSLDDFHPQDF